MTIGFQTTDTTFSALARDFLLVLRLLQNLEADTTCNKARDILVVLRLEKETLWEESLTSSVQELRENHYRAVVRVSSSQEQRHSELCSYLWK